uniref:Large ribosomal subunit protein uL6 n=1 Tax=Pectinaria gouldii TaxID=260746 RepID=V5L1S6_PECGU|nr:60S ribosomal-like protein [Pectinaria gouldii]
MKTIQTVKYVTIPEGVKVSVKSRSITVEGKFGKLTRSFRHIRIDIKKINANKIKLERWFSHTKEISVVQTVSSHIENMFKGVMKGFRYKMRSVYAHFPINVAISEGNTMVEVRNFLGEKYTRKVHMLEGVKFTASEKTKDEFLLEGIDIEKVSQSAALIQQSTTVKDKDIRKFLDGIYVSEKTTIEEME